MNTLATAKADLEEADRNALEYQQEQKALDQKVAENEVVRKILKDIIKKLSPKKTSAKKGKRTPAKPAKPSVRKPDVEAACLAVVDANPLIPKDELKELALHKLTEEQGFGRNGAALQIDKCLLSPRFVIADDDTVSLARPQAEKQSPQANGRMQSPVDKTARRGFLS